MNPRITSIENLIASDPGGRNVFGLVVTDQLRLAAQSLRLAKRVAIVSGFFVRQAGAGETDGPPGAKVLGNALLSLNIKVDYITDARNAPLFKAIGLEPITDVEGYLDCAQPTHLVSIERVGRGHDGRYRNMRGEDITDVTDALDELFLESTRRGLTTIGIGDGGNEIGMGKVFPDALSAIKNGPNIATVVSTDFCIAAGVSNWGAYGLTGALSVLKGRDFLPTAKEAARDVYRMVREGNAVDGVTHRSEPTVDGVELAASLRMLENIRGQLAPSPLERGEPLIVGVLGYGATGRAAAAFLARHGHRVCISDEGSVTLQPGTIAAGVESGGHSIEFLSGCNLVVRSPGVPADSPILDTLHRRGIPVISELELAYQLGVRAGTHRPSPLIAITGTVGKRTTVELLQHVFYSVRRPIKIGGNKGEPLSALLREHQSGNPVAIAVSSFQLETIVHFRPDIAILLNIDEAHLDRHRSIAEYVRIKSRIFMNQNPDDALILPFDDPRLRMLARKHHGRTFFFSTRQAVDRGAWLADGTIRLNVEGRIETLGPADPVFPDNVLATVIVARLCGLETDQITHAIGEDCSATAPARPGTETTIHRMTSPTADTLARVTGAQIRAMCRAGKFNRPTTGIALGYAQANLVVLEANVAGDFERFCRLNPRPCPLLEVTQPGHYEPSESAPGADLRTDLPRYQVYRGGVCVDRPTSIEAYWDATSVAFLIGCSFTFESALLEAGIPVRHIEEGRNVPMYRTNMACEPVGRFCGPLIVSMRPMTPEQAAEAARITRAFPRVHGAPIHIDDPQDIGVEDLNHPDYGDPVTVHPGEIPVFWACGVTPIEAIMRAKPDLAVTHDPGHMFVTDMLDTSLREE